jgi:hypothetical protein
MAIKFGALYDEMISLEQAIERMKIDIENAECDSITKCKLQLELEELEYKMHELENSDFEFSDLNFYSIVESIERCLHCIEFAGDMDDIATPPVEIASMCGNKTKIIDLADIKEFRVYELTVSKLPRIPDIYRFNRNNMPYEITTRANERYVITWDAMRKGLSVRGFNTVEGNSVKGFFNIAKVVAVLEDDAAKKYGVKEVMSCKVMLLTNTKMAKSNPLIHAVDGREDTCPSVIDTKEDMVEGVFQFIV